MDAKQLESLRLQLRDELKSIRDFHYFCLNILLLDEDKSKGIDVPDFHWSIYNDLDSEAEGRTEGVFIAAPVGFSKSTCIKIWLCHKILWRDDYVALYASSSETKAKNQFTTVRKILKNKELQTLFKYTITKDNETELHIEWADSSKSMIIVVAPGQGISGINIDSLRPSIIVIDDIEEMEQAINLDRTNKLEEWMSVTLFSRTPSIVKGKIRMIGTVFTKDCLASRILGQSETYEENIFRYWHSKRYPALDESGRSIWESTNPTEALLRQREVDPVGFGSNYMLEALDRVIKGAYYEKEIKRVMDEERYSSNVVFDPNKTVMTFWDFAVSSDLNTVWFVQRRDARTFNIIDYWEGTGLGTDDIAKIITSKPYNYEGHYGPHDLMKRHASESTPRTLFDMYRDSGLNFRVLGKTSVESGRNAVRLLFPNLYFSANPTVAQGFNHLRSYRAVDIPNTDGLTKEKHDVHSHASDSLRYFATHVMIGEKNTGIKTQTTISKLMQQKQQAYARSQ